MKKIPSLKSRSSLSTTPTWIVIALFFALGSLGLFAVMIAALLPEFWKASSAAGMKAFSSLIWWKVLFSMLIKGLPGFFALKCANRCADVLLDRMGMK